MTQPEQVQRAGTYRGDLSDAEVRAFNEALEENANSDELLDLQPYLSESARKALSSFDVNLAKITVIGRDGRKIGPIPLAHFDPDEVVGVTGGGMVKASCFQAGIEPAYFKLHLPDSRERLAEVAGGQLTPETSALNARIEALTAQVTSLTERLLDDRNKSNDDLTKLAMGCLADTLEAGKLRREKEISSEPAKPLSRSELIREAQKEIKLLREIAIEDAPPIDGSAEISLLNRGADLVEKLTDGWLANKAGGGKAGASGAAVQGQITAADQAIIDAAGGDAA